MGPRAPLKLSKKFAQLVIILHPHQVQQEDRQNLMGTSRQYDQAGVFLMGLPNLHAGRHRQ